jgi:rhodanese-related sulfurtransferase
MLKAPKAIAATFAAVGVDPSKRILLYCGRGMPASFDAVLLHQLGYRNMAVCSPIPSFFLVGIGAESADFVEVSAQSGLEHRGGQGG